MKELVLSFMLGSAVGIGLLLCPNVRHFVDKMENKIQNKLQKSKEASE